MSSKIPKLPFGGLGRPPIVPPPEPLTTIKPPGTDWDAVLKLLEDTEGAGGGGAGGGGGADDSLGWARLAQDQSQFEQQLELNKQQLLESKSQTLIQGFNAMLNAGKLTDDQAKNQFEAQMTEYEALIDNINTTYKNNFESWNAQNIDNYNRQVAEQTRQQGLMSEATTRGRDVARDILPYLVGTTPFNAEKYYNKMGIPVPSPQAISQTPYAPAPAVPELPAVPTGGYQPTSVPPFDIEDLRRKMGLI